MWRPWEVLDGESTEDDRDSKEKEEEEGRLVGVGDEGRGWTRGDSGGYLKCWRQQPIRGNLLIRRRWFPQASSARRGRLPFQHLGFGVPTPIYLPTK
jgi:hypothetical protein